MAWRVLALLTLLAIVALSVLSSRNRSANLPLMSKPEPPQPGYFMTDAVVTQTGADGRPLYRMTAENIQQNPADQSVRLSQLKLDYTAEEGSSAWTLTADSGLIASIDSKTIDLQDNVTISGRPQVSGSSEPAELATVRTSRLRVDAANSTATTREPVSIEWGRYRMNAKGLNANLKTQRLKLESSIHGRIDN